MPPRPDPNLDLDERTARLGREWFAEARRKQRDEAAQEKDDRARRDTGSDDGGLWDWLTGGDAGSDGGGDD